ncbi:MAG: hypothetical protein Q7R97_03500 [Candidatus Daviesbacteria bacterium]|nr:hypothetical protein [Candidatus Daviesbacteria bacterium]
MAVIENLGNMPGSLSVTDKAIIEGKMQEGRIFPNNSNGYFAPDGSFEFVIAGSTDNFYVIKMWNIDLSGLCDQNHRLRLDNTAKKIVVFQKDNPKINPLIIQSKNIRMIKKSDSGLTVVSEGGYVLPPPIDQMCRMSRRTYAAEAVLEEIRMGESSKLFRDTRYSFERVLDPTLVGKVVKQISFKLFNDDDRVISCEGKFVERERVFPFISQSIVDNFYR